MRVPGRSRARAVVVTCEEAKESISARLDGEPPPWPSRSWLTISPRCPACRDFEADAVAIGRRALLRAPRPVPRIGGQLGPAARGRPYGLAGRGTTTALGATSGFGWNSTARWAGALVPAATAVAAISLGVGSHVHLVPTRPPSPCTIGLVARHLRSGG